jgi:hypothetical protein
MLTVEKIDEAAASLEDEEGVPDPERDRFSSAVAQAYSLTVASGAGAHRLRQAREGMDPQVRKWFDRLLERVERSAG